MWCFIKMYDNVRFCLKILLKIHSKSLPNYYKVILSPNKNITISKKCRAHLKNTVSNLIKVDSYVLY